MEMCSQSAVGLGQHIYRVFRMAHSTELRRRGAVAPSQTRSNRILDAVSISGRKDI